MNLAMASSSGSIKKRGVIMVTLILMVFATYPVTAKPASSYKTGDYEYTDDLDAYDDANVGIAIDRVPVAFSSPRPRNAAVKKSSSPSTSRHNHHDKDHRMSRLRKFLEESSSFRR